MATLRMGTRGSALALAQSKQAALALERLHPGLSVETVVIKTTGDLFGAPAPAQAKALPQGVKGLFVKEIEEALLDGRVDFAVHSAKDLPCPIAAGCGIAAYPEREDPRDAFIGRAGVTWEGLAPGAVVATSSLRRRLMVEQARPGVRVEPLRGNVDTRLRKLRDGDYDGIVIAVAGLRRLGRGDVDHEPLATADMLPAPAQGALALEVKTGSPAGELVAALDHAPTRLRVEFERGFLAELGGGCGSPVGAHATLQDGGVLLEGFYAGEGAASGRRVSGFCAEPARREAFVRDLAAQARRP